MLWNQGKWNEGYWNSDPTLPPKPKPHNKPMKRPTWFPVVIGDEIVWLQNFKKLPGYTATLTLVPAEVTAVMLDTDNSIYGLDAYRGGIGTFPDAAYQRLREALHGGPSGSIDWLTFSAPAGTPAPVDYGCLDRIFTFIEDKVFKSPGYTLSIGLDLRTEIATTPAPPVGNVPVFTLRWTDGHKLEIVWIKGIYDGVKLQFDLGTAGTQNDTDLRPNYILNWLPPLGQSAVIKVRLMYIFKGQDTGNWSDWKQWTLTGV